ncbi:Stk1 family PASTA domain-containing Ser/Thr kinase [Streptomyces alfalfae]|uniref:non-specific serine/threonine protein kinase n=1 Tax=Streptomyces alfalfae TaxID=1642299 RepID=A0A1P8TM98_9ACTN|nr:Stk1 family PASTA domain-containing Ser/Thr kinase [Streptomyces alfalfae]AYA19151.1 Stk1 family PASTA domain-containing Ser/Thr kinase [Streptomyces fradiae]APY88738.1 serine/threonine protein kinase [Streptomyces alfalfae]QQC88869.1 Stk1 family PASTA domain-containing Ser/Thr kinase [Streptomyces alfalfae]QUI31324.1 Stk1 family PASTA domain-containing Ser/Thr kinase [Streptomyces alfalfae]RXX35976.1 Stk1 family PASTA domain-containing Ser/Thr kinase [Streptomyces alfalfae]
MDTTLQDPLVGQLLDSRYRIDGRIAVGGMATVYRAVDTRLDRVLALKVMHPTLAADASFVERFIREAKSVARLSHPNVVGVFDQGADGSYVYLAMEYVAGCTLRDVLRERGALQPRAALDILEPVLAALGSAHRAGFVHRDMKPENVLIGDDGRVKVADFGLVRAVDTVTNTTGTVLGTVSYMAPEQIEHGTADTRVDVYACGVLLYEMLTGAKPHSGDTPAQVLYQHLNEDVPPPSAAVPGLPVELDELVASATARTPDVRPYDAVALLAQLRQARTGLSEQQLDAVPPQAHATAHDNADDRTSVIPRAARSVRLPLPADADAADPQAPLNRTSVLATPPPGPPAPARTSRLRLDPRRRTVAAVAAVLLVLGLGAGVWYINSGQFTEVPPLLTKTEAQAKQRLEEAGLDVKGVEREFSDTDKRGTVMATDPGVGERIRQNGQVTLTVSRGPETVKVPDVKDLPLNRARQELKNAGLAPGMVKKVFSDEIEKGSVVSTDPRAGFTRKADSAVALVVSKGEEIKVPDVAGSSLDDAREDLAEDGLKVKILPGRVHSSDVDKGGVVKQSPAPDTSLAEGDTVTLTLSKGPEMIEVPDVTGMKIGEATEELEAAGFEVDENRGLLGIFGDTVKEQSVDGGDKAPKGASITITIR